jgi:hypothetical protein
MDKSVPGTQYLIILHSGLNQLTTAGATALGYDGRGNLISSGTTTYSYTSENRLATQTRSSGNAILNYSPSRPQPADDGGGDCAGVCRPREFDQLGRDDL